jgi:predicted CXXCH cytochrome family protein
MKQLKDKALNALVFVAGGCVLAASLWLPTAAEAQLAGIRNTKHYLGSGAPATNNRFSGTEEICVFCHTPHGAANGAGNPPLWNKSLPVGPYTLYSSSTLDAARATDGIAGSPSIGSVSIACLSCHDGSLALNAVINAPGSGLTNPAYSAGTWTASTGTTPIDPATGRFTDGIARLGTDLSNDHPIGIQYCGGGYSIASGTGTCVDSDFQAPTSAVIGGTRVFWVETGGNTTRSKTDLTLYNRDFGAALGVGPSVECASCHDPHSDANPTFLRRSNAQSALCLSCHVK